MYDDVHNNYYDNLTKKQKEWFDEEGYEELVACDKCGLIQSWNASNGEVYCKGDMDWEENVKCHPYETLCSDCYSDNSKTIRTKLTLMYYKTIDLLKGGDQ